MRKTVSLVSNPTSPWWVSCLVIGLAGLDHHDHWLWFGALCIGLLPQLIPTLGLLVKHPFFYFITLFAIVSFGLSWSAPPWTEEGWREDGLMQALFFTIRVGGSLMIGLWLSSNGSMVLRAAKVQRLFYPISPVLAQFFFLAITVISSSFKRSLHSFKTQGQALKLKALGPKRKPLVWIRLRTNGMVTGLFRQGADVAQGIHIKELDSFEHPLAWQRSGPSAPLHSFCGIISILLSLSVFFL